MKLYQAIIVKAYAQFCKAIDAGFRQKTDQVGYRAQGRILKMICTPDEVALPPYTYMNNAEQILTSDVEALYGVEWRGYSASLTPKKSKKSSLKRPLLFCMEQDRNTVRRKTTYSNGGIFFLQYPGRTTDYNMQRFSNKTWLAAHTSARASSATNNAEKILTLDFKPDVVALPLLLGCNQSPENQMTKTWRPCW